MADSRSCPICQQRVLVRVGIIERHAKVGQHPWPTRDTGRLRLVDWCDASNRRWEDLVKKT